MKVKILLAILLAFSSGAFAKQVDVQKSTFKWKAEKKVGEGHWGDIRLKSSKVNVEKGKIKNAEFVMDLTSFTVDNLEGGLKEKFLDHVKSGDFFEVSKYPTAKLAIEKQDGNSAAAGKLTIKGKTKPVKVKFKKEGDTYSGKMVFDRTQFGIIYNSGNFFKDLAAKKIIKNDVTVDFKVVLKK